MIELRTLGTLELRTTDGQELRPILQQPKRLALLAYLALATPRRYHRRDTLLGLFWPDLDTDHARGSLRRSLHFLRRTLGDNVVIGRSEEEIGIAPDALWCDTAAFEDRLDRGELAPALELYRGELLQGFYIAGAPEFERWLERERARLLERAARNGWTLAEQLAEVKQPDAARHARWAAALTPHDDAAHRQLVTLLARVGDRAGAARAYEEFARRVRADYEMDPSSELQALACSIRAEAEATRVVARVAIDGALPSGDDVPAMRAAASPKVVAVFPFTVRGSRELAYLSEGMVDLLSTTLDGAGELRTVDPRALLAHLAHDEGRPLDLDRSRTAARSLGAGRFLLGSIVHVGGRIRITATMYDASATVTSTAESAGSSEAGIFEMVDDIARQLLAGEHAGPLTRLAKLAARTTESLPALKAYLRGEAEFRAGQYFQALESFQNAASEDTGFALAWYRLAGAAAASADEELAREASEQASSHRTRLGQHDRVLLDAQRAWLRGAADEAERLYSAALETHVDDVDAWFALGDVLFHHNPQRGRSMVESRDAFERALRFDPEHLASLVHLARLAAFDERADELDALVDRVLELSPAGDRALSMRALRAFALRNEIEKARTVTALGRARAVAVGIAFTDILLYAHDIPGTHRLARIVTRLTPAGENKAMCYVMLAMLNQTRGRFAKATAEIGHLARLDPAWACVLRGLYALHPHSGATPAELEAVRASLDSWDAARSIPNRNRVLALHNGLQPALRLYLIGSLSARLGDCAQALALAETLARSADAAHVPGFTAHLARSVRAQTSRAAGDAAGALRILDEAPLELWYQLAVTSPIFAAPLERFLRAELLEEAGRDDEAVGWYAALGETSPHELPYVAPAQLRLAAIHARQGRASRAAECAARAEALWG